MDLLIGTFVLRPYVFGFLAAFLVAGAVDLGIRRTLDFAAWVGPLAWLAEFSSTRIGIPFGLYHYTGTTRAQELFIADVPFMDCLSFTFLCYAAFCLARVALAGRRVPAPTLALVAGVLMMLLDVVIDPLAVRGDRWFLGRIFFYPDGGVYFGVPLSNFAGWVVVGTLGVGGFMCWSGRREAGFGRGWPAREGRGSDTPDRLVRRGQPWPGVALYYAVFCFNLGVTAWIGEWMLVMVGTTVHLATALALWSVSQRPAEGLGLEKQQA
ncbi:MAG TPA: carotenoid biosynthesis protein [Methylomirabilota bacterium]|jgi:putative membrane protein